MAKNYLFNFNYIIHKNGHEEPKTLKIEWDDICKVQNQ